MVYCATDFFPGLVWVLCFLFVELVSLGENARLLQTALDESRLASTAFREQAQELHQLGNEEDRKHTLRDSVVFQQYYTDLLKEEIRVMTRLNRSWWFRLKKSMLK